MKDKKTTKTTMKDKKTTKGAFGNRRKNNGIKLRKPKFAQISIWK